MTGAAVLIDGVTKSYGEVPAVRNVSLDVRPGEFLSLLGPSGSGKTTLLMMIAGFERADAGLISVGGRNVTHVAPNKRNVGMVFQKYALFPHMSVSQNIAFPLKMRGRSRTAIACRVAEMLSMVRLDGYGDRMPGQLSGGQQQRVAVARALVFEPPVLLMDEPLGALDKKLREQMQIEIKALQERLGVTVIYVTHDQEEALTMSDRIAVMRDGMLEQIGAPIDLYHEPASAFVAEFIGRMNFLEAEVLAADRTGARIRVGGATTLGITRLNGTVVHAIPGNLVSAAIRPESISVAPAGTGGDGALTGIVEASVFVGSHHVLLVRPAGRDGEPLHVQMPAGRVGAAYAKGAKVDVVLDLSALHVFPARSA